MSGLFSTLNASVSALQAHSRAIEVTGKNLANVNNSNYARQTVLYGSGTTVITADGAQSVGITATVEQLRDALLDNQVMREKGLTAYYEAMQSAYQRAQASLGETINSATGSTDATTASSTGLSAALDDLFTTFQSLAASPTDVGERQALMQKANTLVDSFQLTDERLGQVQSDLDSQIGSDVSDVNDMLKSIADLNDQIKRLEVDNPGSATDLRDQRQTQLEALGTKLPVIVGQGADGQMQLTLKDAGNNDVVLVDGSTVNGAVTFTGAGLTAGVPPTDVVVSAGSIQGALTARDGAVQTLRDNLDLLTQQLVTSVNAAYNPTAAAGKDFFTATGLTAGTITLAGGLTATTLTTGSSGAAGDNDCALAVANLASQKFSTAAGDAIDGTLTHYYSSTVSGLGQSLASANSQLASQTAIETLVRSQRDAVSGVSLDEESANLLKYQRAYQASARVFSVVDELLNTLINNMGR